MPIKDKFSLSSNKSVGNINQPFILAAFVFIIFSIIGGRLFSLQILNGSLYKKLSEGNRIRLIANPPIRGRLLDRNGTVLADNKLSYSLSIQPRLITKDQWPILRDYLSRLFNISSNKLEQEYQLNLPSKPYRIVLLRELSIENVLKFKEREHSLIGAQVDIELIRNYPYKTLAAHTLGYTQFINDEEYISLSEKGYKLSDQIGRRGLEAVLEPVLRGEWGGEMLEVDAIGVVQRSLGLKKPQAGRDVTLTIDLGLQQVAETVLSDKTGGAVIALDPRNGAIRAMASKPTFDPNFFSKPVIRKDEYERLFFSSSLPLLSRAINAYDPGSTWKPITAIAGMESGKFPPRIKLETSSCIRYGNHCFPEHNGRGFGRIGYEDALRVSSNTFFYQIGVGVGSKLLYEAATKLGFDQHTGIENVFEESKGLIGHKEWADQGRGSEEPGTTPWIPEDIASASIGQSVIQVTPLQLARAYAVFANGGFLITPHLIEDDKPWLSNKYRKKVDISESTLETIRRGLRKVVISGTGMRLNDPSLGLPAVAGKSGTAEDSSSDGPDHAWFACFTPYDSGEIVVVAFAQSTPGGGSVHALPMAKQVLLAWKEMNTANEKVTTSR